MAAVLPFPEDLSGFDMYRRIRGSGSVRNYYVERRTGRVYYVRLGYDDKPEWLRSQSHYAVEDLLATGRWELAYDLRVRVPEGM